MERERVLILSASAGSGKTYRLAYKYVRDVIKYCHTKPHLYRAILAVTFTNKATEEIKNRILEKIDELINNPAKSAYMEDLKTELKLSQEEIISRARKIQSHILHDYSRFTVLTIDKFFQRILRAFIKELGLDLNYNIELDAETILARGTDSLIEEITQDEELQRWMLEYAEENIDDNGNWDLRKDLLKLGDDIFKDSSKQAIVGSKPREELLKIIRSAQERVAKSKAKLKTLGEESLRIIAEAGVSEDVFINKKRKVTSQAFGPHI
jgi:ATP-dependent exoDNAse (exonuclease V) beta subunit